jgi:GLPGLI family protein
MKKTKTLLTFYCIIISFLALGQTSISYMTQTQIKGAVKLLVGGSIKTSVYYQNGTLKIITQSSSMEETYLIDKDSVKLEKTQGLRHFCAQGTIEEYVRDYKEPNKKYISVKFENVNVETTSETKKILNYTCKKAIVKYSINQLFGGQQETVMHCWYTEEIKPDSLNALMLKLYPENADYLNALNDLGGLILRTEYDSGNNNTSDTTIENLNLKKMPASIFKNVLSCKKKLTIKS